MRGWLAGMSRRRRLAVAGLAFAVAAGGVGGGIAAAAGHAGAGKPGTGGHRGDLHGPAQPGRAARPGPVVLVPGYGGSTGSLSVLAARIRAAGRPAIVVHLPGTGTSSLARDAAALNRAVTAALRGGARSVDVIGYSAGGVAALFWARDDGGAALARRVITLGSPFHGTQLAAAALGLLPQDCPAACRQLVPGSSLLTGLDSRGAAGLPPWLSLWTTGDRVVIPPDSADLPGAINVPLQSLCPADRVSHSGLPTDPVVQRIVLRAIGPGPLRYPSATVCGR
jgi:triacylglycerol lipase